MHHLKHKRIVSFTSEIQNFSTSFSQVTSSVGSTFNLLKRAVEGSEYLFFDPLITFRVEEHVLRIAVKGQNDSLPMIARPLQDLQSLLESFTATDSQIPFAAGVTGYFGYDCVRYLESMPLPAIRRPEPEAFLFVYGAVLFRENGSSKASLVVNEFQQPYESEVSTLQRLRAKADSILSQLGLEGPSPNREINHAPTIAEFVAPSYEFVDAFHRIKEHLSSGDVFQCVLSESFTSKATTAPIRAFDALVESNPSPYHFCLMADDFTVVGASPEPFLKVQDRECHVFPIAGTRPRSSDPDSDRERAHELLQDPKEVAEHTMLVDLARNDLGRVCKAGTVHVKDLMRVERFRGVMHLVSHVAGELEDKHGALDAFFACFPAGTLTGAPKVKAMEIISKLETRRRGAYGGAMLLTDFNGKLDSAIIIRSAVYSRDQVTVQAGAGIVYDSSPEAEALEIHHKFLAIRQVIGATEQTSKNFDESSLP